VAGASRPEELRGMGSESDKPAISSPPTVLAIVGSFDPEAVVHTPPDASS
jgi:hypothetical protein